MLAVCGEEHRFLVQDAFEAAGARATLLLEPAARNTAAAIALAALQARGDELLLVCPSDHHIPDAAAFARAFARLVEATDALRLAFVPDGAAARQRVQAHVDATVAIVDLSALDGSNLIRDILGNSAVDAIVAVRRYEQDKYGTLEPEELTAKFRMAWSV